MGAGVRPQWEETCPLSWGNSHHNSQMELETTQFSSEALNDT